MVSPNSSLDSITYIAALPDTQPALTLTDLHALGIFQCLKNCIKNTKLKALRVQQNQTASEEELLSVLNKISTHLVRTPGFHLKRIDYRQGRFDFQFIVANLQALEYLKQRLTRLDLTVEIQSASSRNGQVESRLRIHKSLTSIKK